MQYVHMAVLGGRGTVFEGEINGFKKGDLLVEAEKVRNPWVQTENIASILRHSINQWTDPVENVLLICTKLSSGWILCTCRIQVEQLVQYTAISNRSPVTSSKTSRKKHKGHGCLQHRPSSLKIPCGVIAVSWHSCTHGLIELCFVLSG